MSTRSGPTLLHNGYTGSVEVSMNDNCLHGRIQNIDDVIAYEGQSPVELQREFVAAVDEYLKHCRVIGKAPDRPYGGSFNVRVGTERHRWIIQHATQAGLNVNEVVCKAIDGLRTQVLSSSGHVKAKEDVIGLVKVPMVRAVVGGESSVFNTAKTESYVRLTH